MTRAVIAMHVASRSRSALTTFPKGWPPVRHRLLTLTDPENPRVQLSMSPNLVSEDWTDATPQDNVPRDRVIDPVHDEQLAARLQEVMDEMRQIDTQQYRKNVQNGGYYPKYRPTSYRCSGFLMTMIRRMGRYFGPSSPCFGLGPQ